jgi:hypothetical protein
MTAAGLISTALGSGHSYGKTSLAGDPEIRLVSEASSHRKDSQNFRPAHNQLEQISLSEAVRIMPEGELGGLRLTLQTVEDTFVHLNQVDLSFYGIDKSNTIFNGFYFRVGIYSSSGASMRVGQFRSPDCSLFRTQLYKGHADGRIYLISAEREERVGFIPQALPREQKITIFQLFKNERMIEGRTPIYFAEIYSTLTSQKYCDEESIDALMRTSMATYYSGIQTK